MFLNKKDIASSFIRLHFRIILNDEVITQWINQFVITNAILLFLMISDILGRYKYFITMNNLHSFSFIYEITLCRLCTNILTDESHCVRYCFIINLDHK